jgi:hypothetical protein
MQVKWVAAPPKLKDLKALQAQNLWMDYEKLCTHSLAMFK